jgi:hypothetical protein
MPKRHIVGRSNLELTRGWTSHVFRAETADGVIAFVRRLPPRTHTFITAYGYLASNVAPSLDNRTNSPNLRALLAQAHRRRVESINIVGSTEAAYIEPDQIRTGYSWFEEIKRVVVHTREPRARRLPARYKPEGLAF